MSDPDAIAALIYAYAEAMDAGDFDAVADLFAAGRITAAGRDREWRGRDAVLRLYTRGTRRYDDDGTPHTRHVTTNVIVDVNADGAAATSRSYFTVFQALAGELPLQPIIAGRYHDRFARGPDGTWCFAERHMIVDLTGDLSHHLLFSL